VLFLEADMSNSPAVDLWEAQAEALTSYQEPNVPLDILIGESVEIAKFYREFWEPTSARPGLRLAGDKLPPTTGDELLSLHDAVQQAQTAYHLAIAPREGHQKLLARAAFVLGELEATLEWHFDDGIEDETDQQLRTLSELHSGNTGSSDSLAQAIHDYATLAKPHAQALDGVGGFDSALIDEGLELAVQLGDVGQGPTGGSKEELAALELRNRLAHMLFQRMSLVRRAARFVFRDQPEIVRQATSAYQRRQRAARRRAQAQKAEEV